MTDPILQQFGGSIATLENVIRAFPESAWAQGETWHQPWYMAFHCLFWTDYYLSEADPAYAAPAPFTNSELVSEGYPDRVYTREELADWAHALQETLAARMETVKSADGAARTCTLPWGTMNAVELLLYNMRHVQHHAGQLNMMIRQASGTPARWVMRRDGLKR